MTAGQIVLLIVGVIVGIITLALFTNVRVHIIYDGQFKLTVSVWGITAFKLPADKPPKNEKAQALDKKVKEGNNAPSLEFTDIVSLLDGLIDGVRSLFGSLHVTLLDVAATIGTGDAAETAIKCGAHYALIYPALGLLCGATNAHRINVNVQPDYERECEEYQIECKLRIRIFGIVKAAIKPIGSYLKNIVNKTKEGV